MPITYAIATTAMTAKAPIMLPVESTDNPAILE